MNESFDHVKHDKILLFGFSATGLIVILSGIIILLSYQRLPPFLPLYNQLPWGDPRLGEKVQIGIPFLIATGIAIVNTILAETLYNKMTLLSRILSLTSFLVSLFILLLIIRTVLLVI